MPNLRRRASDAMIDLSVENKPSSKTGAACQVDNARAVTSGAPAMFCKSAGCRVVLDVHGEAEIFFKTRFERDAVPSRQIRRTENDAALRIERSTDRYACTRDAG